MKQEIALIIPWRYTHSDKIKKFNFKIVLKGLIEEKELD